MQKSFFCKRYNNLNEKLIDQAMKDIWAYLNDFVQIIRGTNFLTKVRNFYKQYKSAEIDTINELTHKDYGNETCFRLDYDLRKYRGAYESGLPRIVYRPIFQYKNENLYINAIGFELQPKKFLGDFFSKTASTSFYFYGTCSKYSKDIMSLFEGLDIDATEPSEKEKEHYESDNKLVKRFLDDCGLRDIWNEVLLEEASERKWKIGL